MTRQIKTLFTASIIAILAFSLINSWQKITSYNWQISPIQILFTTVILLMQFFVLALAWQQAINGIPGQKATLKEAFLSLAKSNLSKYLPGGFWDHVGRYFILVKQYKLKSERVFVANALFIFSAIITGLFFLPLALRESFSLMERVAPSIILILLTTFSLALFFPKLLHLATKNAKSRSWIKWVKKVVSQKPKKQYVFKLLILIIIHWFLLGLAYFETINMALPIKINLLPIVIASYSGAWVLGFLSFFSPMGLGVREYALVFLLKPLIPVPVVLATSLFIRFIIMLRDLLLGVSVILYEKKQD